MVGHNQSQDPIRTAIVGLGRAGWLMHAVPLQQKSGYRIVACVDPVAERRAEAATQPGVRTYSSYEDFLGNAGDTELVIVATANTMHAAMSIQALQRGMHVAVEKPMAVTLAEGRAMLAAARAAGRILTVHQSWRCQPEFRQVQSILRSGVLGKVFNIKIHFTRFARRNDWQTLRRYGGGMMNNTGAHALDMALMLLESKVVDVCGDLQSILTSGDTEDHVKVFLRGENGRVVDLEASDAVAMPQPRFALLGSQGSAWTSGDEFIVKSLDPSQLRPLPVDPSLAVPNRVYGVPNDVLPWQERRLPREPAELQLDFHDQLYESIRNGKDLLVKAEEVCEMIRVMGEARRNTTYA